MNNIYRTLSLVAAVLLCIAQARAQDTFSIVAVDLLTGEVGSAGASCLAADVSLISDVHPGIGAVHTQALYSGVNQDYANGLMSSGHTPRQIIDSMIAQDAFSSPEIRQYGVVTLAGDEKSAAFTGDGCTDYKGHITGPTYSIQGNILLGRQILDSMEARFLREPGTLADKLMAALQGANVAGADTRCMQYGTSSLSAFLRIGKPGDNPEALWLDLRATIIDGSVEPIDSLQRLYDRWKLVGGVNAGSVSGDAGLEIAPNPASGAITISYRVPVAGHVRLALFDALGREVALLLEGRREKGEYQVRLDDRTIPAGSYYCRLSTAGRVVTGRLVVGG